MLYYYRIDVSEGIDINITSASKECEICHNWYFLNINLNDIAILNINCADYHCIIN